MHLQLLLVFITPFLASHAVSPSKFYAIAGAKEEASNSVVSYIMKRSVLEGSNVDNSSLILAAKRTHRRDPSNDFKHYSGGWNISNKHYLSSVSFTAAPLLIIAAIWLLGFGLCLIFICLYLCCCKKQEYGYSRTAYAISLIALVLCTIAAVLGCTVLYTGQGKFHSSSSNTLDYVVWKAYNTVEHLKNVSDHLAAAKQIGVGQNFLPSSVQNDILNIERNINKSASTLEHDTEKNSSDIKDVLALVRLALIILAAIMLLLTILGFVFSIFGMKFLINSLVIIGGILVAVTFVLCGLFLVLHNVVEDTCIAMDEWVQHPVAHTALDDILPCMDDATTQETLSESKNVSYQLVNMVNQFIDTVANKNLFTEARFLYYNQSGPIVPLLCNPFYPNVTDRKCVPGEVNFSNAIAEWRKYICEVSSAGNCITTGRLTPTFYDQLIGAANMSYALHHYMPFLADLQDCTFVREAFNEISKDRCPGLRKYSKWIYIGLIIVSTCVMLSLILWVLYGRERRHRAYTKVKSVEMSQQDLSEESGVE